MSRGRRIRWPRIWTSRSSSTFEQTDLDALGQVGQLVDGEDAPVDPRDQPVVQGQLVGEVAALGDLDRVDLADQVGDGGVGGGQLLAVAVGAVDPVDRGLVALLGHPDPGEARRGVVGVVVDLGAGDDGQPLVEQLDQGADEPGLGLAPLPEQDHVVPGQEGVLQLGDHRVLEAQHARDEGLAGGDAGRRRCGASPGPPGWTPTRGAELAERAGEVGGREGAVGGTGRPWPRAYAPAVVSARLPVWEDVGRPKGVSSGRMEILAPGPQPGGRGGSDVCEPAVAGRGEGGRCDHGGGCDGHPGGLGGRGAGPTCPPCARTAGGCRPVVTVAVLTAFVGYATWAAFVNKNYYVGAGGAPQPDLALLLPVPHRELRARGHRRRSRSSPGGPSRRPC